MKGKITVVSATAIPDISSDALVSVYPNPLTGSTLYLTFKNHTQRNLVVSVYDLAGNLILSENGSTTNGQYSCGLYRPSKGIIPDEAEFR